MSEEKILSWRISPKKCNFCNVEIEEAKSKISERDCLYTMYSIIDQHKLVCASEEKNKKSITSVLIVTEKTNRFGNSVYSSYNWIKAII